MSRSSLTRSQTRRIAAATLVALIGLIGTTALGFWQYSRAHRDDISRQVLAASAVPVDTIVAAGSYVPESAFGHRVTLPGGRLSGGDALLSCGRHEQTPDDCWLIAPIHITARLAAVAVLGSTPRDESTTTLTALRSSGAMVADWSGRLQPAELVDKGHAILRPSDTVDSINVNELALRWNTDLLDGYVVVATHLSVPGLHSGLTSPLILPPSGITWRNLIYAWQWWAFAAFVLFLLTRYVIDVRGEAPTLAPVVGDNDAVGEDQS